MPNDEIQKGPPQFQKEPARPDARPENATVGKGRRLHRAVVVWKGQLALVLGIFSFIPCLGLLLGPVAVILGIQGVRFHKQHPAAPGLGPATLGIVMGALTSLINWGCLLSVMISGMPVAGWK